MNGKRAKAIRQEVYGDDYSPKFREYKGGNRRRVSFLKFFGTNQIGTVTADGRRQTYQKAKKNWVRKGGNN